MEARAARLGLRLHQVAERMGIGKQHLSELFTDRLLTEPMFLRLCSALEMAPEDWDRPLPPSRTPLEKVRAMRRAVTQKRTEKTERSKIGGGGRGPIC